jgi:hypothetical protein
VWDIFDFGYYGSGVVVVEMNKTKKTILFAIILIVV